MYPKGQKLADLITATLQTLKNQSLQFAFSYKGNNFRKYHHGVGNLAREKGPEAYLADASFYLEMFGVLVIAWQWLIMPDTCFTD